MRRLPPSRLALLVCTLAGAMTAAAAAHPWCERAADLTADAPPLAGASLIAPTGTLRVGVNVGNPNNASIEPSTGRMHGVAVDMACMLAARLNVPLEFLSYPAIPPLLAGLESGAYDLGFSFDPMLAPPGVRVVEPHVFVANAYLVAEGSRFRSSADLDAPTVTIAVARGNSPDVFLSKSLRSATLRRAESVPEALAMLKRGEVDAFAGSRAAEIAFLRESFPQGRMLADNFLVAQLAMFVRPDASSVPVRLDEFLAWARQSGRLGYAVERAKLAGTSSELPR